MYASPLYSRLCLPGATADDFTAYITRHPDDRPGMLVRMVKAAEKPVADLAARVILEGDTHTIHVWDDCPYPDLIHRGVAVHVTRAAAAGHVLARHDVQGFLSNQWIEPDDLDTLAAHTEPEKAAELTLEASRQRARWEKNPDSRPAPGLIYAGDPEWFRMILLGQGLNGNQGFNVIVGTVLARPETDPVAVLSRIATCSRLENDARQSAMNLIVYALNDDPDLVDRVPDDVWTRFNRRRAAHAPRFNDVVLTRMASRGGLAAAAAGKQLVQAL